MKTETNWKGTKSDAWIETYSGIKFNVFDPKSADVNILDIAHALSMCTRFNGHLCKYYSVAEHSWIISQVLPQEHKLAGLLHDASEAYLSDIPRPIKYMLPEVKEIDTKVSDVILQKYGIHSVPDTVHLLDRQMCLAEAEASNMNTGDWDENHDQFGHIKVDLRWWNWRTARFMFIERFHNLTKGKWQYEYYQMRRDEYGINK